MKIVQIFEAKTHLTKLVEEVEAGAKQEIIITRHGRSFARLVALSEGPAAASRVGVEKIFFWFLQALTMTIKPPRAFSKTPVKNETSAGYAYRS